MNAGGAAARRAGFVAGGAGALLCIDHFPETRRALGRILLLPPFAEELNKSRRMVSLTARALAADGWQVRVADPYGCGDSAGDFADATLDRWIDDSRLLIESLGDAGAPLWLWALRGGALWLPRLLEQVPHANLLLWQPVLSGRQALTQFLRLKAASSMLAGREDGAGSGALRRQLIEQDVRVEVAGYTLTSALARGLDSAAWAVPDTFSGRVVWLEVANPAAELSPAAATPIERLRSKGLQVDAAVADGPAFWQTTEIEDCPALIERTRAALAGRALDADQPPQATQVPA